MALLTVMKGLPLAYNKDMQEDKEAIFDSVDTVKMCLPVFTKMVATMSIRRDNMLSAARGGFTNATDIADYLVKKGVPFRDAHAIVGRMVACCIEQEKNIEELGIGELKAFSEKIEMDVYEAISLETCVNERNLPGGPAIVSVKHPSRMQRTVTAGRRKLKGQEDKSHPLTCNKHKTSGDYSGGFNMVCFLSSAFPILYRIS